MTKILTLRLPAELHQKAEARALRLGLDRAKYVRSLIEDDVSEAGRNAKSTFASEDLVGLYQVGTGSATNASVRQGLQARAVSCFRDRAARPEGRTTPPTDPDERN